MSDENYSKTKQSFYYNDEEGAQLIAPMQSFNGGSNMDYSTGSSALHELMGNVPKNI